MKTILLLLLTALSAMALRSPRDSGEMQNSTFSRTVQVTLGWTASLHADWPYGPYEGVTYRLYAGGRVLGTTTGSTTITLNLKPMTTYSFTCVGVLANGRETAPSNTVTFRTGKSGQSGVVL